ncbi:transporter substrate-binding domain-containing protein [Castellaniella caeni]|uniref:transporter substrate-binding domain-containing protein n=1 Tax=Castellaniella caeni TaxID=266123 RepID=UPI0009FF65C0|nr:transporter substrate-binding domain-containing protein [Castellaniella caeni]
MPIFRFLKLSALSVGLTLAFTQAPANADQLADVQKAGVITLATDMNYQPFDYTENNQHVGFDKDLWAAIGTELGVKPKFLDLPWTTTLAGLQAKRFDMVNSPVAITKERMEKFHFTLPFADGTVGLIKRASDHSLRTPQDIGDKTVGSQRGTIELQELESFAKTLPSPAKPKAYLDLTGAYADLANGRIDAVADAVTLLEAVAKSRPDTFAVVLPPFGPKSYFAYLARKGPDSDTLVAAVDKAILKIEADGRMKALQEKWFGTAQAVPQSAFVPDL